jgi:hypothetical protein
MTSGTSILQRDGPFRNRGSQGFRTDAQSEKNLIDDPGEEWDLMEKRPVCIWVLRPVAARLGALQ